MQRTGLNSINNFPNFYLFLEMIFRTSVQYAHKPTAQSIYLFGFIRTMCHSVRYKYERRKAIAQGFAEVCSFVRVSDFCCKMFLVCVDVLKRNNIKVYCLISSAVFEPLFWRLQGIINIHSRPFCRHIFCISLSLFLLCTVGTELLISACSFSFLTAKRTDHHYYRLTS